MSRKAKRSPSSPSNPDTDGYSAPPERWQHGSSVSVTRDAATGIRTQSVSGAFEHMLRSGSLLPRHKAAADRWLADFEFGVLSARDPEKRGTGAAGSHDGFQIARLDAVNLYFKAKWALGPAAHSLLEPVLHERLSLTVLEIKLGRDRRYISGKIEAALDRLVEHYYAVDNPVAARRHTIVGSESHQPPVAQAA
ncbi:hypothetical protein FHR90_003329 [Endobacter medicaginis]|uniref:Uncharacterized protein n=1 Tax=Endobacter medicaginis TaxID=1181271 RepID=A0A839V3W0_9PROT|nr:hypothetical protein [Endobacter medicaginis]MBB3175473.1 hypothetical protein [Endobacter medicaginis]MCX5477135.1 hypothetical protein [Endobacter medicaginis]NVN29818.1 hypothetical protein [Endobacter medicaginis]